MSQLSIKSKDFWSHQEQERSLTDIAPCKVTQDSLGISISRCGFRIPGTGFQSLSVELGLWIPSCGFRISGIGSGQKRIVELRFGIHSNRKRDSGFLELNSRFQSSWFRIPPENNSSHSAIWIALHGATNTFVNRGSHLFNFSINNSVNEKSTEKRIAKKAGNKGMDTEMILTLSSLLRNFNFIVQ